MAAAAVWAALAVVFGASGEVKAVSVAAFAAAAALYVRFAPRPRLHSLPSAAIGIVLTVGALYLAFIGFILAGSCAENDNGHVPLGGWIAAGVTFAVAAAWSLQRSRRAWWGLPGATLLAAFVLIAVSTIFTGSTGVCLS